MSNKFTQGEWHPVQYGHWFNIQDEPYYNDAINLLDLEECEQAEENAKLMAAAPDLLEALKGLVKDVRNKPNDTRYATHIKIAEAAIKKATD